MPMPLAPRIKPRPASRAPRLAIQILPNRHLRPASPTQNRPRIPLPSRPNRNRMPRQRNMAILASIVDPATPHLDRHNIHRRAVMHASRLTINLDPAHLWTLFSENSELPSVTGDLGPLCAFCALCASVANPWLSEVVLGFFPGRFNPRLGIASNAWYEARGCSAGPRLAPGRRRGRRG